MEPAAMRVFISYDRSDGDEAGDLRRRLDEEGFRCFVAHDDITMSEEWQTRIWEELTTCDCFVGLISVASAKSVYCVQEIAVALARLPKERFVLAHLDGTVPPGFAAKYQAVPLYRVLKQFDRVQFVQENRVNVMIERLGAAGSFQQARQYGRPLLPYLKDLTDVQLRRLLHLGMNNRQVWDEADVIGPRVLALFDEFERKHGGAEAKRVRWPAADEPEEPDAADLAEGGGG